MILAASYSRFSSDMQRDTSIEDQNRICKARIEQEGWKLTMPYSDYAISGASLDRPGLKQLMEHAANGEFDVLVVEGLDRLSRDSEHMPGIYKRLTFNGVRIYSLTDGGFVSDIHIAFGGAKNALFLKDLAFKVKRGQAGLAQKGKAMAKNVYGYDIVRRFDADGNVVRGERKINDTQAAVVRRIFEGYAEGKSAHKLAAELNKEGISNASGRNWGAGAINGVRNKGTGMLNNEIYIGRLIWNKSSYQRNPDTEQRIERPNDKADWVIAEVPELRIIDQDLWDKVKTRQTSLAKKSGVHNKRRPKRLLSYRLKCGACGGGYAQIGTQTYGCYDARDKGTCDNRIGINQHKIEGAVLKALSTQLLKPELMDVFAKEYNQHLKILNNSKGDELSTLKKRLQVLDHEKTKLVDAIKAGIPAEELKDEFNKNASQRSHLSNLLVQFNHRKTPPELKPDMAQRFQEAIESLTQTPAEKGEYDERIDLIQALIDKVVLTPIPETRELKATLYGDLAALLLLDEKNKYSHNDVTSAFTDVELNQQGMATTGKRFTLCHSPLT